MGTHIFRPLRAYVCAFGLVAAGASAAQAAVGTLQASWAGGRYVLLADQPKVSLHLPGGEILDLPMPKGGRYSSVAALEGGWIAAGDFDAENGSHQIFVVWGRGSHYEMLPGPKGQRKGMRQDPVILARDGELLGMAWLEGDTRQNLEVRASVWNGERWRSSHRVARRGRGSQLALSGTVLADDSWLLTWSAFDGEDDEILWALRRDRQWLPPRALGAENSVPDIVPAVSACGFGAVAAWSRYDGNDYRMMLATFDGEDWRPAEMLAGAGALYPTFHGDTAVGPQLLFREVGLRGWTAMTLDETGAITHRVSARETPKERPVLEDFGSELQFSWTTEGLEKSMTWQSRAAEEQP